MWHQEVNDEAKQCAKFSRVCSKHIEIRSSPERRVQTAWTSKARASCPSAPWLGWHQIRNVQVYQCTMFGDFSSVHPRARSPIVIRGENRFHVRCTCRLLLITTIRMAPRRHYFTLPVCQISWRYLKVSRNQRTPIEFSFTPLVGAACDRRGRRPQRILSQSI